MSEDTAIQPDTGFGQTVAARSGENVDRCYQCLKCTTGCPLTFSMDFTPSQVMRMIQLGLEDELLQSLTIWTCSSCQTCTTRCPNDIDIAHVMDTLRQLCAEADTPASQEKVVKFHDAFLKSVRRHGRAYELGLVASYKMRSGDVLNDARLGAEMFKKGKMKLLPRNIEARREVRDMFKKGKQES